MQQHDHESEWNWKHASWGLAMLLFSAYIGAAVLVGWLDAGAHTILHDHHDSGFTINVETEPEPEPGPTCPSELDAVNWYFSPDGDNRNLGVCGSPMRSLFMGFDAAQGAQTKVILWLAPGTYARENIEHDNSYPHGLEVRCPEGGCIMDGEWKTARFYRFRASPGACQNVTFDGLTVTRYINGGFSLNDPLFRSERENRDQNWNGCNTFRNLTIVKLGSHWGCEGFSGDCKGYLGIGGQNTDRNIVENVTCDRLKNKNNGGIHCIYWSNGSSDNQVIDTSADDISAPAFKTRDDSNRNVFEVTCTDVGTCYYSGVSRDDEVPDKDIELKITKAKDVDHKFRCRLEVGGPRTADNCDEVFK